MSRDRSTSDAAFWQRVQRLLDARREPLADFSVREYLDAHPELLEEYAELAARLRTLEENPAPIANTSRRAPRLRAYALGFAALALLGLATIAQIRRDQAPPSTTGQDALCMPEFSTNARVRRWTQSVMKIGASSSSTHASIDGYRVRTHIEVRSAERSRHLFASVAQLRSEAKTTQTPPKSTTD